MKNRSSYKAVLYQDSSMTSGFWIGKAIDKQLSPSGQLSDYWISEFLASEFATTPAAGSRRLAVAVRDAIKKSSLNVKEELIAAAALAKGLAGEPTSIKAFMDQYHLSQQAKEAVLGGLKSGRTAEEQFKLDIREFRNYVAWRSIELDNGALITAETEKFDDVITRRELDGGRTQFSTIGKVIDAQVKSQH